MKKSLQYLILILLVFNSCNTETDKVSVEKWKQEIREVEQDFANMAKEKGIHDAFLYYASEDVVLKRRELIVGKKAIDKHLEKSISKKFIMEA